MSFKICHIGCGGMSVRGHGPALHKYSAENGEVILSGCCDLDINKAENFAQEFGFSKAYDDWEKMLVAEKPEAVSLVVPVPMTADMSVEILNLGYNLITEKPLGMTKTQCKSIITSAIKSKRSLGVMFNRRYMPLVKKLRGMLNNKKIKNIKYDFYRTGRKDADFSTTVIHGIDTAQMLSGGNFSNVSFEYQIIESTPVGNIFVSGITNNGTRIDLGFFPDSGMNAERVVAIAGASAYFLNIPIWDCYDYPGSIREFRNGKLETEILGENIDMFISSGFYDEHKDFYESVQLQKPSPADLQQHLISVEVMQAIRNKQSSICINKI